MFVTDKDFAEHIVGGREMRCNGFYVMLNLSTGKDLWSCIVWLRVMLRIDYRMHGNIRVT